MRLHSGEQILAMLENETESHYLIESPMLIKMFPVAIEGKVQEHVVAQPLCQFTSDKYFDIPKNSVVFVKQLHESIVPHYERLVDAYDQTATVKLNSRESLSWEDEEEEMTAEEFKARLDELEKFFGVESETDSEPSSQAILVEGNDTKH
jgi:hypothetical protein